MNVQTFLQDTISKAIQGDEALETYNGNFYVSLERFGVTEVSLEDETDVWDLRKDVKRLEDEVEELQWDLDQEQTENYEFQETIDEMESENNELEKEKETLEAENANLKKQVEKLQLQIERSKHGKHTNH